MKNPKMFYGPLFAALLLSACVVAPSNDRGRDRDRDYYVVAPALPMVVELGVEPYYFSSGFFYYYQERDHRWSYSRDRAGPWNELPRDRYPRETRFKDRDHNRDRGHNRDGDHDRDRNYR